MNYYSFRTIIEPDEKGTFHGWVPRLQGCHTFGNSIEETKNNLKEAIICHVQGLIKDGLQVPQEQDSFETVQTFSDKELVFAV